MKVQKKARRHLLIREHAKRFSLEVLTANESVDVKKGKGRTSYFYICSEQKTCHFSYVMKAARCRKKQLC